MLESMCYDWIVGADTRVGDVVIGLQWLGAGACSPRLINSIGVTIESTKKQIRNRATGLRSGFIPIFPVANVPKK